MSKELKIDEMFLDPNFKQPELTEEEMRLQELEFTQPVPPTEKDQRMDRITDICLQDEKNISPEVQNLVNVISLLDQDSLMDIIIKIIENDPDYEDIPLSLVVRKLEIENIDPLFYHLLTIKDERYKSLIPFLYCDELSRVAHLYIEGKCQFVDMDYIYPFLRNNDIKLVLEYFLKKRRKEED